MLPFAAIVLLLFHNVLFCFRRFSYLDIDSRVCCLPANVMTLLISFTFFLMVTKVFSFSKWVPSY